jgi:hypothetical protein
MVIPTGSVKHAIFIVRWTVFDETDGIWTEVNGTIQIKKLCIKCQYQILSKSFK